MKTRLQSTLQSTLKTGLLASAATLATVAALGDRPAQASNYGPLPLISADQIDESSCYLRDENNNIVDLTWLCDGGQGTILPAISVTRPHRQVATAELPSESQPNPALAQDSAQAPGVQQLPPPPITAPVSQAGAEFSDTEFSDTGVSETVRPDAIKTAPRVIHITGGKTLEAIQEINAAPSNPYEHLGIQGGL